MDRLPLHNSVYNHVYITQDFNCYANNCEMAEAQVAVCMACARPVPVATNRRRFKSASSSHVLPTLSEIVTRVDPAALSAILDPKGLVFVCRCCFSSLEKLKT